MRTNEVLGLVPVFVDATVATFEYTDSPFAKYVDLVLVGFFDSSISHNNGISSKRQARAWNENVATDVFFARVLCT